MTSSFRQWGHVLLAALLFWCASAPALSQQAVPALSARVIDQTATLSDAERSALEARLAEFEAQAGPQIVLLLVASTQPEDIAAYAQRVADTWKIGRREVGDGVLMVVAKDDRRLRIEVAKALEGAIPDLAARQIIQNSISPAFKAGNYAAGLNAGLDQLMARIEGEHLPTPRQQEGKASSDNGWQWEELGMFFFVAVPVIGAVLTGMFGRKLGSLLTSTAVGVLGWWFSASLLLALLAGMAALILVGVLGIGSAGRRGSSNPVIWGSGHGGGFGGGGFGGGGFSSGGGGDFGGGGASGDW